MNVQYDFTADAVTCSVFEGPSPVPVSGWEHNKLYTINGQPVSYSVLERLRTEGDAHYTGDALIISNKRLATCALWEMSALGLPPPVPFQLRISSKGALTIGSDFTVSYGFHSGSRYIPTKRKGLLLEANSHQYCLSEPIFTLLELLDAYVQQPIADPDERVHWWGKVTEILPDPKIVEGILGSYKVVPAQFFTLNIQSARGQLHITPRFLKSQHAAEVNNESEPQQEGLLPEATHQRFISSFKTQPLRSKYGLSGNYFVALSPDLHAILDVVKGLDHAPLQEKIDFINNPYAVLKAHLSGKLEDQIIDSLFVETPIFLSERVQGLCIWEARGVIPRNSSGQAWLPEDLPGKISFEVDGKSYAFTVPEFKDFMLQVASALEDNVPYVPIYSDRVPLTPNLLDILRTAAMLFRESHEQPLIQTTRTAPEIGAPSPLAQSAKRNSWEGEIGLASYITLQAHQSEGLKWLQHHWRARAEGALLADDMGLGKTLQTLTFMWWLRKQMETGHAERQPVLIVAPTALLKNWKDEAQKFFPDQSLGQPFEAYGKLFSLNARQNYTRTREELMHADWVLTTYETMRDKIQLFAGPFALLVLDEAQRIKNASALVANNAKAIKADMCLALTGTPVENSLQDLLSIIDRIQPQCLEVLTPLAEEYDRIECAETQGADNVPTFGATSDKKSILMAIKDELEHKGHPVLLRRLKETHWKERPEKRELVPFEDIMPSLQAMAYETALVQAKEEMAAGSTGAMLKAIQRLRQISLHPPLSPAEPPEKLLECSARISRLMQLLDGIKEKKEKVLVFIEYLDTQSRLQKILREKYHIQIDCINGNIPGEKRQAIVDRFQSDPKEFDVLLLSPKAGGVGLNLTAANHVVHLSRWWNPAVEDQCTDRVYRIGQSKAVTLYYPLAVHPKYQEQSFDWSLHNLLQKKRNLSRTLLAPVQSENGHSEIAELWENVSSGL